MNRRTAKIVEVSSFLAAMVLSAAVSNPALGVTYKAIDLTPSGFNYSYACGIYGTQQVGEGSGSATGGPPHALLWNGSAASFIDLNPSGFGYSDAFGISGNQQVGSGWSITAEQQDALLWNGSADNFVDLNPTGFYSSRAYGISGTQQVGYGWGSTTGDFHALLWNGSATSFVDLNPSGFDFSEAYGTNGTQQVGYGWGSATGGNYVDRALLWNGSADNYIDLCQFLPAGFGDSEALSIDSYGNIVGDAIDSSGNGHAILWQPIPEPASFVLFALAGLFLRKR
jgi:hypothetical protein